MGPTRMMLLGALMACTGCNLFTSTSSEDFADSSPATDAADVGSSDEGSTANNGADVPSGADTGSTTGAPDVGSDTPVRDMPDPPDAAGDVASPDLGMPDIPPDIGPDPDPCNWPDTVFCSGFEDPSLSDWTLGTEIGIGDIAYATGIVRTGVGSLRAQIFTGDEYAVLGTSIAPPLGDNDEMWVRAFIYVANAVDIEGFEWAGIANPQTDEIANATIAETWIDGHFHLNSYEGFHEANLDFPGSRWVCVEWRIQTSPTAGSVLVAADGVTYVSEGGLDVDPILPLNAFAIGILWSDSAQQPFSVWFDDVFVGRSRPGCN